MGSSKAQAVKAAAFLKLHLTGPILMLPNAWDAASARIFQAAGFPAIATTSGGVANALGFADGERTPREEMVAAVGRIVRSVDVPVTADMEMGYGRRPADVFATVAMVLRAGAIGINLEDGLIGARQPLREVSEQVERIAAAREAGKKARVPLVINARTDVFLRQVGDPTTRLKEAARRANIYREAGAGCLFVPGVIDAPTIGKLAREIQGPLNVLAFRGLPALATLARLGVRRASIGAGPMRAAMAFTTRVAQKLRATGRFDVLFRDREALSALRDALRF